MEQFVLVPPSVQNKNLNNCWKTGTSEVSSWKKSHKTNCFAQKGIEQTVFCQKRLFSRQKVSSSTYHALKLENLFLDGVETRVFMSEFAQQLRRKNEEVPDIWFALLDAAGRSPILNLNQKAKAKGRGSRVPFKIWNLEATKSVHIGCCCFWACAQLIESLQSVSINSETIDAFKSFLYQVCHCHK